MPFVNQTETTTTTTVEQTAPKSVFQLLADAEARRKEETTPSLLGTTVEAGNNVVSIVTGSVKTLATSLELGNMHLAMMIDEADAQRVETQVECQMRKLSAISKLVELGATPAEAIDLGTRYRA